MQRRWCNTRDVPTPAPAASPAKSASQNLTANRIASLNAMIAAARARDPGWTAASRSCRTRGRRTGCPQVSVRSHPDPTKNAGNQRNTWIVCTTNGVRPTASSRRRYDGAYLVSIVRPQTGETVHLIGSTVSGEIFGAVLVAYATEAGIGANRRAVGVLITSLRMRTPAAPMPIGDVDALHRNQRPRARGGRKQRPGARGGRKQCPRARGGRLAAACRFAYGVFT